MRRLLPFAVLGGCLVVGVLPALAANQDVGIRDFSFTPRNVAVLPGESVHWAVEPGYVGAMHNVHFDDQTDPLGPQSATFSGSRQFAVAGTYRYRCDVHPAVDERHGLRQPDRHSAHTVADGLADGEPHRVADRDSDQPRWRLGWVGWRRWRGWGHSAGARRDVSSFRVRAASGRRGVFLTLSLGAGKPVRVRGTLRRGKRRVRSVTLRVRPGRHKVRLPGKG